MLWIERVLGKIRRTYWAKVVRSRFKCGEGLKVYGAPFIISDGVVAGGGLTLYPGVSFAGDGAVRIGDNVTIGKDVDIYASKGGGIRIGNDVAIAAKTYIIDCDHGFSPDELIRKQPVVSASIEIGNDVWIAAGCKILKGVSLGDGCVIGAGAVVTKSIPAGAIAVGVPAKVIGFRQKADG